MFQGLHRPPTNSLYWRADSKYVKNITVDPRVQEISLSKLNARFQVRVKNASILLSPIVDIFIQIFEINIIVRSFECVIFEWVSISLIHYMFSIL